ncbi:hypothetical protein CEXT_391751 [Caerostris extrusa]|uniref:Uncharacterized protein n=1 Tax=Caerostris extrusa TaxID=172846 RepID=A0AAV4UEI7_CAEEX|nr:hypothetical protein CEXT_391751 [Caerostris extrusa]
MKTLLRSGVPCLSDDCSLKVEHKLPFLSRKRAKYRSDRKSILGGLVICQLPNCSKKPHKRMEVCCREEDFSLAVSFSSLYLLGEPCLKRADELPQHQTTNQRSLISSQASISLMKSPEIMKFSKQ